MKKYWSLTLLFLFSALLIFSACGDPYENVNITASQPEISFILDENNTAPSQQITASVTGGPKNMNRLVGAVSEPAGVVRADVTLQNSTNYITFTPLSTGVANIYLKTVEGSVTKQLITVRVEKEITDLKFKSAPVSVAVGQTLNLNTENLINFTPSNTSDRTVNYQIVNGLNGVSLVNQTLTVAQNAGLGIITVRAVSTKSSTINDTKEILIYKGFSSSDINLRDELSNPLNKITLAKNTSYLSELNFEAYIANANGQNIQINAVSLDPTVAICAPVAGSLKHEFNVCGTERGETKLRVTASIVSGDVTFVSVTRDFDVSVVDAVDGIKLTRPDGTVSNDAIDVNVFTDYPTGVLGTRVAAMPVPTTATEKTFKLTVTDVTGGSASGVEIVKADGSSALGAPLPGGTAFFIRVTNSSITSFRVAVAGNLSLAGHEFYNYINCVVKTGVNEISASKPVLNTGAQDVYGSTPEKYTLEFSFTYNNGAGTSADFNQAFKLSLLNPDLAQVTGPFEGGIYKLIGLKQGRTKLRIEAENGKFEEFNVNILIEAAGAGIKVPALHENSRFASLEYYVPSVDAFGFGVEGASSAAIEVMTNFTASVSLSPLNASYFGAVFFSDNSAVAQVGDLSGSVNVLSAGTAAISLSITVAKFAGGEWILYDLTRIFNITSFWSIGKLSPANNISSVLLYDQNSLYYTEAGQAVYNAGVIKSSAMSTVTLDSVSWAVSAEHANFLKLGPQANASTWSGATAVITAKLPDHYSGGPITAFVTATLYEFGRVHTVVITVTIIKPVLAESVFVDEYHDDAGIYLEARNVSSAQQKNYFTVNAQVEPASARNSGIIYAVYHAEWDGSKAIATAPYLGTDDPFAQCISGIEYFSYTSLGGLVTLAVLPIDSLTGLPIIRPIEGSSGYFVIRPIALDRLTIDGINMSRAIEDLWGVVADGTRSNPYRIYTAADLNNIGANEINLNSHYLLMNDIDLSVYTAFSPLGIADAGKIIGFSGSLKSFADRNFKITGLNLKGENAKIAGTNAYLGLFAKLERSAQITNITIICESFSIDLDRINNAIATPVDAGIYIGMLAGVSFAGWYDEAGTVEDEGFIENVTIRANGANTLTGTAFAGTVYLGGLVGASRQETQGLNLISYGVIYSCQVSFGFSFDAPSAILYAGGLTGENNGIVGIRDEENASRTDFNFAEVNFTVLHDELYAGANAGNSRIGGIAGRSGANNNAIKPAISYVNAQGIINAPYNSYIGGAAGENHQDEFAFITSAVRIRGHSYIGGLIGLASGGEIKSGIYEIFDDSARIGEDASAIIARGTNVGGLIGESFGTFVSYSFVISYMARSSLVTHGINLVNNNEYYGDILTIGPDAISARVGGLIGYAHNTTVVTTFALAAIQATGAASRVGGFIGECQDNRDPLAQGYQSVLVRDSYARGQMKSVSAAGGFIGYVDGSNDWIFNTSYCAVEGAPSFIASASQIRDYAEPDQYGNPNCFFLIPDSTPEGTDSYGAGGRHAASLKKMQEGNSNYSSSDYNFATLAYLATVIGTNEWDKYFWAHYGDSQGNNEDYPVLLNENKDGLLLNIVPESLDVNVKSAGSYAIKSTDSRIILIWDLLPSKEINLDTILDYIVVPLACRSDLPVSVKSSQSAVAQVITENDTIEGSKLQIKSTGSVKIEITSRRNLSATDTIEISIVRGFNGEGSFGIYQNKDLESALGGLDSATGYTYTNTSANTLSVRKDAAKIISPSAFVGGKAAYLPDTGVRYSATSTAALHTDGYLDPSALEGYFTVGGIEPSGTGTAVLDLPFAQDNAHLITGKLSTNILKMTQSEGATLNGVILVKATPYLTVNFDGVSSKHELSDLTWYFFINVYDGVSSVGLDHTEAVLQPRSSLELTVTVYTDNPTLILNNITNGSLVLYEKLNGTSMSNTELTYAHPNYILNSNAGLNYFVKAAPVAGTGFVRFTLLITLNERRITQSQEFELTFRAYDESGDFKENTLMLTYNPQEVERIDADFYYSKDSYEDNFNPDTSNEIASGKEGLLKLTVGPLFTQNGETVAYADFDAIRLASSLVIVNGRTERVSFMHRAHNGATDWKNVYPMAQTDAQGRTVISKINSFNDNGESVEFVYDDTGEFYITALLSSGLPEGLTFIITIEALKNGAPVFTRTLPLTTRFVPYVEAKLKTAAVTSDNLVARGTKARIDLTVYAQNSTLECDSPLYTVMSKGWEAADLKTSAPTQVNTFIDVYFGLECKGEITFNFNLKSITNGVEDEYRIEFTVHVVDFIILSAGAEDVDANGLPVGFKQPANLIFTLQIYSAVNIAVGSQLYDFYDSRGEFEKTGAFNSGMDLLADYSETTGYAMWKQYNPLYTFPYGNELDSLYGEIKSILRDMNALGGGAGGIWSARTATGGAFAAITKDATFNEFTPGFKGNASGNYTVLGKMLSDNVTVQGRIYYRYVLDNGGYVFNWSNINIDPSASALSENSASTYFALNIRAISSEEEPVTVMSAADLRNMQAGVHYILQDNIKLEEWVPLNSAIASLDGNGYIIELESFDIEATRRDPGGNIRSDVNLGFFGTVSENTLLKNLIVDIKALTMTLEVPGVLNVNFGIVAGVNNGIIYNCEVITTFTLEESYSAGVSHGSGSAAGYEYGRAVYDGLRENYNNGIDTVSALQSIRLETSRTAGGSPVSVNAGGLAGQNSGFITNSRVGRIAAELGNPKLNKSSVQGINIFASGTVGGLAAVNSGVIASSYYANGLIVNSSNSGLGTVTGGLVGINENNARITASYAEGIKTISDTTDPNFGRAMKGGIQSYGSAGGFVHTNNGYIDNSYANMHILSSSGTGGFVYRNMSNGVIEYCYSLSLLTASSLINGAFTGINSEIILQNEGEILNSYFLKIPGLSINAREDALELEMSNMHSSDADVSTGQVLINSFAGFVFKNELSQLNGAMWAAPSAAASTALGPQLVSANKIAVSLRELDAQSGFLIYESDYEPGSENNPVLIKDAASFNRVFSFISDSAGVEELSPYVGVLTEGGEPTLKEGVFIRLVSDIDFSAAQPKQSTEIIVSGHIDGNGMKMLGVNKVLSADNQPNEFGLFKRIERGVVVNLSIQVLDISATRTISVGALAGKIVDSAVTNITVTPAGTGRVSGENFVGGLAGMVEGVSQIENIKCSVSVIATYQPSNPNIHYYYGDSNINMYSYAGGVIGLLSQKTIIRDASNAIIDTIVYLNNTLVKNLNARGLVLIEGENVGGIAGCVDTYSVLLRSSFYIYSELDSTQRLYATNFAGGIAGINLGRVENCFVSMAPKLQRAFDMSITAANANSMLGATNLFSGASVGAGGIAGLNINSDAGFGTDNKQSLSLGAIVDCYSRVAVINTQARSAGGLIGVAYSVDYINEHFNVPENITTSNLQFNSSPTASAAPVSYLSQVYTTGAVLAANYAGGLIGFMGGGPVALSQASAVNNFDSALFDKIKNQLSNPSNPLVSNFYFGSAVGFVNYSDSYGSQINYAFVRPANAGEDVPGYEFSAITPGSGLVAVGKLTRNAETLTLSELGNSGKLSCTYVQQAQKTYMDNNLTLLDVSFASSALKTNLTPKPFDFTEPWSIDVSHTQFIFPELSLSNLTTVKTISSAEDIKKIKLNGLYQVINPASAENEILIKKEDFLNSFNSIGSNLAPFTGSLIGKKNAQNKYPTIIFEDFDTFNGFFGHMKNASVSNLTIRFLTDISVTGVRSDDKFGFIAKSAERSVFENVTVEVKDDSGTLKTVTPENLYAFGGLIGESSYNSIINCRTAFNLVNASFTASRQIAYFGGIFGVGQINYIQFLDSDVRIETAMDISVQTGLPYPVEVYMGGLAGFASSLTLEGSALDNLTVRSELSAVSTLYSYIGGAFGGLSNSNVNNVLISTKIYANTLSLSGRVYAGGLAGTAAYTSIDNVKTYTDNFNEAIVAGESSRAILTAYAGGLIGQFTATVSYTSGAINANKVSNIQSNNTIAVYSSRLAFAGGVFGEVFNELSGNVVQNDVSQVYSRLISKGSVAVYGIGETVSVFAGGIAGRAETNEYNAQTQEITQKLNHKGANFSECISLGSVTLHEINSAHIGGFAGYSSIEIANSMSNCDVNLFTTAQGQAYMGGLAGELAAGVISSYCTGTVNQNSSDFDYVGAVIGYKNAQSPVTNVYYADDVSMAQDNYAVNVGLQVAGTRLFGRALVITNLSGFDYVNIWTSDTGTFSYPRFAASLLTDELATGGELKPFTVSTYGALANALTDGYYKVILIDGPIAQTNWIECININSWVEKILGCGNTISIASFNISAAQTGNLGLFDVIPQGVSVSAICVDILETNINAGRDISFGGLAGENRGLVYNCTAGYIPSVSGTESHEYAGCSPDNISTINLTLNSNLLVEMYIGSLIGRNGGIVANCSAYTDIYLNTPDELSPNYVNYTGGLVGYSMPDSVVKDSFTNGIISAVSVCTDGFSGNKISGVIGFAQGSYLYRLFGYGEVSTVIEQAAYPNLSSVVLADNNCTVKHLYGNNAMSRALKTKLTEDDNGVNYKSLQELAALNLNGTIYNNSAAVQVWAREDGQNYMYPYLKTAPAAHNTGDGDSNGGAAQIWHEAQFWLFNVKQYFALTRNIEAEEARTPINFTENRVLHGNSKTITLEYVHDGDGRYGLFKDLSGTLNYLNVRAKTEVELDNAFAGTINFGGITARYLGGSINKCTFTADSIVYSGTSIVNYGGIAASGTGTSFTLSQSYAILGSVEIIAGKAGYIKGIGFGSAVNPFAGGSVGGLVGVSANGTKIDQCFTEGNINLFVEGKTGNTIALGGLVGTVGNNNTLTNCYTYGGAYYINHRVNAAGGQYAQTYFGALYGNCTAGADNIVISTCYTYNKIYFEAFNNSLAFYNDEILTGLFWGAKIKVVNNNAVALYAPNGAGATISPVNSGHSLYDNNLSKIQGNGYIVTDSNDLRSGIALGEALTVYDGFEDRYWAKDNLGSNMAYLKDVTPQALREQGRNKINFA